MFQEKSDGLGNGNFSLQYAVAFFPVPIKMYSTFIILFLTDRQNIRAHLEMISFEEDLNALQYGSRSPR